MSSDYRAMRSQATNNQPVEGVGEQPRRPTVKVQKPTDAEQHPDPLENQEPPVQEVTIVPSLLSPSDIAALLQSLPDELEDDEDEEHVQITLYLEPAQAAKIADWQKSLGEKNVQNMFRFLVSRTDMTAFEGFAAYIRERKVQRLRAIQQRSIQRTVEKTQRKLKKLMGQ